MLSLQKACRIDQTIDQRKSGEMTAREALWNSQIELGRPSPECYQRPVMKALIVYWHPEPQSFNGAMLSLTTGGPEEAYQKGAFNGDIAAILRPIHRGMLQFVGFDVLEPQIVYGPVRSTDEERKQQLADYALRLQGIESEAPMDVGIY